MWPVVRDVHENDNRPTSPAPDGKREIKKHYKDFCFKETFKQAVVNLNAL